MWNRSVPKRIVSNIIIFGIKNPSKKNWNKIVSKVLRVGVEELPLRNKNQSLVMLYIIRLLSHQKLTIRIIKYD